MSRSELPLRTAPFIHMALTTSSLLVIGVFWFLRGGVPIALLPAQRGVLSYVGYGLALALLVASTLLKRSMPDLERGSDVNAWWAANGQKALVLWALGDAGCVAGGTLWFLTDNQFVLLALGGIGLLVLAAYRPSKLLDVV